MTTKDKTWFSKNIGVIVIISFIVGLISGVYHNLRYTQTCTTIFNTTWDCTIWNGASISVVTAIISFVAIWFLTRRIKV